MFLNKMKKNERSKKGSSSTADVLNKGLLNLKQDINRSISEDNIDIILNNDQIFDTVIKIFSPKDFFNRGLLKIESHIKSQKTLLSITKENLTLLVNENKIM